MTVEIIDFNCDGHDERRLGPRGPNQSEFFTSKQIVLNALECYDCLRGMDSYAMQGSLDELQYVAIETVLEEDGGELEMSYMSLGVHYDDEEDFCDVRYYVNNWQNYYINACQRLIELYEKVATQSKTAIGALLACEMQSIRPPNEYERELLKQFHEANISDREVTA